MLNALWVLSNVGCDSYQSALHVLTNDVFNTVNQKMLSQNFAVRKEAMIVVGHILTCLQSEHLYSVLEMDDSLLTNYL